MLRKLAAATLAVVFGMSFIAVEPASAVTHGRSSRRAEKVRTGISALGTGPDTRISLKVRGGARYSGYVSSASETSFVVTDLLTGMSSDIQYGDVTRARGNNLSTGAKIAIGAAIGAAAVIIVILILRAVIYD